MRPFETHTEEETIELGREIAAKLVSGDVVAVYGDLGSGKTRLIQGVCRGFGVTEHVASPTFTILRQYAAGGLIINHFDFYRVQSLPEARDIGFEEYVFGDGVCLIEWAERVGPLLPPRRYEVHMKLGPDRDSRIIEIHEPVIEVSA